MLIAQTHYWMHKHIKVRAHTIQVYNLSAQKTLLGAQYAQNVLELHTQFCVWTNNSLVAQSPKWLHKQLSCCTYKWLFAQTLHWLHNNITFCTYYQLEKDIYVSNKHTSKLVIGVAVFSPYYHRLLECRWTRWTRIFKQWFDTCISSLSYCYFFRREEKKRVHSSQGSSSSRVKITFFFQKYL